MKWSSTVLVLCLLAAPVLSCGCIQPGDFDPGVIAKYQRQMADYAPSKRLGGRQELGLLDPAPREGLAPFKIEEVKDDSGKVVDRIIRLKLEDAVVRALANSPAIQVVSFDPAISREDMVQAAAAFDVIVFGAATHEKTDNKRYATLAVPTRTDERDFSAGLRQLLPTGTQWELTWAASREWDDANNAGSPTSFEPTVNLEITQPLLRGGWMDFNLGRLRVARLAHKSSMEAFRLEVENTVTQVYQLYWRLHQAHREAEIQKDLMTKTRETHRRVLNRREIDATNVQAKQAESAVASRNAALARARKIVYDVQDQLGVLLGDPQINAVGKYRIVPASPFEEGPATRDVRDQLAAALKHNPTLAQGRLAIQASGVQIKVAENELLPRLDLIASGGLQGMAGSKAVAGRELLSGDYPSYSIGIQFEYPIGNRQRESRLRVRKLERQRAVASFQQAADQIAAAVRERIRQIATSWNEVTLQRAAITAAKIQLKALNDIEKIKVRLTPEFLQLKLSVQEIEAEAKRAEVQSLVDYNSAIIELRRVTGTVLDMPGVKLELP